MGWFHSSQEMKPAAVFPATVTMLEMSLIGESFHPELLTFPCRQDRDECLDSVWRARIPQTCDLSKSSFLAETLGKHLCSHKSIHQFCIWDVNISWVAMKGSVLATNLRALPPFRIFLISCCGPGRRKYVSVKQQWRHERPFMRNGLHASVKHRLVCLLRRYLNPFH